MLTWLHFPSQNPPKTAQKSIPRGINFLIDFWMDFLSILAPTWGPTWSHVGHFFGQNGGTAWKAPLFFVALVFFSDFFARDPGVPHRTVARIRWGTPPGLGFRAHVGSVFKGFVVHFASFAALFLASILALFSCSFSNFPCWLKGWWGYAKRQFDVFISILLIHHTLNHGSLKQNGYEISHTT